MGAMKELLLSAEYVFTGGDELWDRWSEHEDHGLLVYAFAGGRWSWTEVEESNSLADAFFIGGEGVTGDSPIFCKRCALDLRDALDMEYHGNSHWTAKHSPKEVFIKQLELGTEEGEVMHCPCGFVLFSLVSDETLMLEYDSGELPLDVLIDYARELEAFSIRNGLKKRDWALEPKVRQDG